MAEPTFNRFEKAKSQAKQETFASKQAAQEAIARRFAQMGMQGSGASIKQQQLIDQQSEDELGKRLEGITGMEEQEISRQKEIKEAKDYQTKEREASQSYASKEREAGQSFSDLMLKQQQAYATGEREASQIYGTSQAKSAQEFTSIQQGKQNDFAREMDGLQGGRFNIQMKLEQDKFDEDKRVNSFNMDSAKSEAGKKDVFGKAEDFTKDIFKNPLKQKTWKEALILSQAGLGGLATIPAAQNFVKKTLGRLGVG